MRRRDRQPTKPFPAAALAEILGASGGLWCLLGVVQSRDQGSSVVEITDDDVRVDVLLQTGQRAWARLAFLGGGPGVGFVAIPGAGAEVLVALPDGTPEGEAIIVATLSTGQVVDGAAAGKVILAVKSGDQVLIHDGNSGDAKPLATKDDVDNHTHQVKGTGTTCVNGSAWTGTAITDKPTPVTGTQVLRAK